MATSLGRRNGGRPLVERLVRAMILDRTLYEEVASDRSGLSQAIGVVMIAGMANGMALSQVPGTVGVLFGIIFRLIGWVTLSAIVFIIGAKLLRARSTSLRSVTTCLGFAEIPSVANLLGALPNIGVFVRVIVWFWLLAATIVATRAAFRVSLGRAAVIGGLGFGTYLLIGFVLSIWAS